MKRRSADSAASRPSSRPSSRLWVFGTLLFLLGFIGSLIATWPIRALPALGVPGLTPLHGSLWHGQWQYTPSGAASATQTPWIIHTRFAPSALLHGALGWQIHAQGNGIDGHALLLWRGQQQHIANLRAGVDVGAQSLLWQPSGNLQLQGTADITRGLLSAAHLSGEWQNAQIITTEPLPLGAFHGEITVANGQLRGQITSTAGANAPLVAQLDLSAPWPLTAPIHASGFVQATAAARPALSAQLGLLGTADDNGRIPLNGILPLR